MGLAAPTVESLDLRPNERILIIAPHPDDEVIACGGLIQEALALGDSVWVAYVTAGDGSWPSAWRVTGNMFPGTRDYIELGRARMEEAQAGTETLGLDSTQLVFLGYPDNHIAGLWQQNWRSPLRSSHTGVVADPYGRNGREYTGRELLADLTALLRTLRPDRLFAPSPLDAHPDHWSAAMFAAIVRETWRPVADGPFPEVFSYLVHRPPYPDAQIDESGFLSPPDDLADSGHHWFSLRLADRQRRAKQRALGCHDSQQGTFGSDLYGYVTNNELFDRSPEPSALVTAAAPRVSFIPDARLSSVLASVEDDSLDVQVLLPCEPWPYFDYSFFCRWMEADADTAIYGGVAVELRPDTLAASPLWVARVPWRHSGHGVLLYSVEVKWGSVLLNHSDIGRLVY